MPDSAGSTRYSDFSHLYLAGRWTEGRGEKQVTSDNPYDGSRLATLSGASEADIDAAYRAAAEAQPAWEAKAPAERGALLLRVAEIMEARREEIVEWLIAEAGSTRLKAILEHGLVQSFFRAAAALPHMVEGRLPPSDEPGKESRAYRKAVGVVGLISPWNWPLQLTARTLAPALAVGNAVVVKPASDTPVTGGLIFGRLLEEAGLPEGLVSVLPGSGSEIGDFMVQHPVPRVISFTGSTPVGRGIAAKMADSAILKRLELELGGNGPLVVLADADLDRAVEAAVWGKFLHQGQICMIANRIIVEAPIHDAFVERFVEKARGLQAGDPDDPDSFIGPIINKSQLDGLLEKIEKARQAGCRELLGGEPEGLVLPPHVFTEVPEDAELASEEIFGPIAPVLRARDAEDALRIANATEYGLSSAVFTGDLEKGTRFARRLEAGMAHVNDQPVNDLPFSPFGGEKNSGLGRFNGRWAIDAFTTEQWVTLQHEPRPYPFRLSDLG